jgi:short-subunit dehydrogenase
VAIAADVAAPGSPATLVGATLAAFGRLDVLVNNAGITMWSRFDALSDLEVLERLIEVNYLAAARLTHAALPALRDARGLVVAVASVAGLTGVPERTGYAASKHAMVGFFESLRIELAGSGVDVTIVAPDFVRSEIHRRAIGPDGRPLGRTPMQESRIMTAEACAVQVREAMEQRERLRITSLRGRWGLRLKPFVPGLLDRIAARAIRERR